MSIRVRVDDRDPKVIYSGEWKSGGLSKEYRSTIHGTHTAGATVRFSFSGTATSFLGFRIFMLIQHDLL